MTVITCDPRENHLLCALTHSELEQLTPHLELVTLSVAEVVFEVNEKLGHVYFPVSVIASMLCCLEDGSTVEVAMIGKEGVLGFSTFLGKNESSTQVIINQAGYAYRISVDALQKVLTRSGGRRLGNFRELMLRYAESVFVHMSQTIACTRRHAVDRQLCTWLLTGFDRATTDTLSITQASIGYILGVRRETITEAAKKLQDDGMIDYGRGYIVLKDRRKLETGACECYEIKRDEAARLSEDLEKLKTKSSNRDRRTFSMDVTEHL